MVCWSLFFDVQDMNFRNCVVTLNKDRWASTVLFPACKSEREERKSWRVGNELLIGLLAAHKNCSQETDMITTQKSCRWEKPTFYGSGLCRLASLSQTLSASKSPRGYGILHNLIRPPHYISPRFWWSANPRVTAELSYQSCNCSNFVRAFICAYLDGKQTLEKEQDMR